jgi:hypothetical protein
MPYTLAWDEIFPPDTQPANLLGDDIRKFKRDIRERVASFGFGPTASRPTPEAVFVGVGYFDTDTGKIYRWNGASWDDVTNLFLTNPSKFTNSVAVETLGGGLLNGIQLTLPAASLVIGSVVDIVAAVRYVSGTSSGSPRMLFGAVPMTTYPTGGLANYYHFQAQILVTGATTQKGSASIVTDNISSGKAGYFTPTETIANPIVVKTVFDNGAGDTKHSHEFITAIIS